MALPKRRLGTIHTSFNPAAVQRQIQALCDELLTLATAKGQPTPKPRVSTPTTTRTFPMRQRSNAPGPLDVRQRETPASHNLVRTVIDLLTAPSPRRWGR